MSTGTENINLDGELQFKTSRSSGKGGQHVNKVETKVDLYFDVLNSEILHEFQKRKILKKLANRISKEGILSLSAESERTQLANRKAVIAKFYLLIKEALKERKKRKPTKPGKGAVEKRLKEKKIKSEKKAQRRKTE